MMKNSILFLLLAYFYAFTNQSQAAPFTNYKKKLNKAIDQLDEIKIKEILVKKPNLINKVLHDHTFLPATKTKTPLALAAQQCFTDKGAQIFKLLVDLGADVHAPVVLRKDNSIYRSYTISLANYVAIHAEAKYLDSILSLLRSKGVEVNSNFLQDHHKEWTNLGYMSDKKIIILKHYGVSDWNSYIDEFITHKNYDALKAIMDFSDLDDLEFFTEGDLLEKLSHIRLEEEDMEYFVNLNSPEDGILAILKDYCKMLDLVSEKISLSEADKKAVLKIWTQKLLQLVDERKYEKLSKRIATEDDFETQYISQAFSGGLLAGILLAL